jgi:hypothetical protein
MKELEEISSIAASYLCSGLPSLSKSYFVSLLPICLLRVSVMIFRLFFKSSIKYDGNSPKSSHILMTSF